MTFLKASQIFNEVELTSSRNEMMGILVGHIKDMNPSDLQIFTYLIQGRVAPMFIPAEFNLSEKGVINALTSIYGEKVLDMRQKSGDLGQTASQLVNDSGESMSLESIYEILWKFVNAQGKGSVEYKHSLYIGTLKSLSSLESLYFTRIILGTLRLGCSTRTLLDAFSMLLVGDKSARSDLDMAYGSCADIGYIATIIMEKDAIKKIRSVVPIPGVPVLSRLVERVKSFEEVGERFSSYLVEPKYDGLRCQIHKVSVHSREVEQRIWFGKLASRDSSDMFMDTSKSTSVKLFTRNLEDITEMFPEIVSAVLELDVDSVIFDSEIVGWNSQEKTFLAYQDTMTRRRKYGVQERKESIPVSAFVFDLMYIDGKSLLAVGSEERFNTLRDVIQEDRESLKKSPCDKVSNITNLRELFDRYIEMGLEGVIVKSIDSTYQPGVRNFEWIKIKKSIDSSFVDTVDLVVLGYYLGSGKRSKFGIGAILGGVYNPETEMFESVTKVGTGITDSQFGIIKSRLDSIKTDRIPKGVVIEELLLPDVYVQPQVVITVDADEISRNRSSEGIAKGLSLRFPRLVEFDRADKGVSEVTTVDELFSMLKK